MKNSNDTIGNRSRDLPVCSAVPQALRVPTTTTITTDTTTTTTNNNGHTTPGTMKKPQYELKSDTKMVLHVMFKK
jgi:hypothetical protein